MFVLLIPIDGSDFSCFPVILCFQWVEKTPAYLNCAACDFFLRPSDAGPDSGLWSLQTSFYAECYGPLPLEFLEKLGEFQAREFDGTLGKFDSKKR